PDNSIGQVLKLGLFTKLGLYSPGRVPLKGELWGLRKDQKVPPGEEWRLDPVDGIIWSSKNVATPQDNLYQPPMSSRELFINATDIIPKTGFGAHFGVSGEINATFKSASGELVHLPVAIGKFRIGNSDTSRIEHRGESQTGPVGVSFVKSLGFNSADISFFGNLMIANNEPGAIRHLFKTANIRSEFGWILRAWTSGPIIPFTQSLTSNRQKYYNPFTVITKVILKDGREITDWREFQKQYFTGDPKTLTKAQKGEQRDENYNIEFENQIAYVEIGPMSVEILPPKKRKDLKKHRKAIKKIQEDLEEGLLTTYETDAQTLLNSVRSKAARYNLYSLDVNSNAYHSHRAVRGLLPLIAMLQAWDIRPENLRVSVYVYKNGKQRISVRFSDWGSILGKAVGFTGNTNADPNRYPLDIITKSGKDWRGRPRIVLNVQGNSISKAALHADYDSIKWGFSQIGRLTKDQIFQIIGSGQFSSAYTYAMAMKFMMARDKALEILFTRKEIESEFGGFLAVANGQRVIDPTTLQFSSTADLPIEHNGRVIATMKSDGTYVKDGIYYKANGEIHDPAVEKK
ncbi:MAG: hypothetical protein KDD61_03645, partial [Bdellovibrionales bacterium]|nr:hypothetical protein [Bdellovibrionales bacterium]